MPVRLAEHPARLSDLHAIAETRAGSAARGTLNYLAGEFFKSTKFAELAERTQQDYRACAAILAAYPTKLGLTFGELQIARMTVPLIQRLVEDMAKGKPESRPGAGDARPATPSKANHVLRFLRRLFAWGIRFGLCTTNPARGVEEAKERQRRVLPGRPAFSRILAFARERGALPPGATGSLPAYLAPVMELTYRCRLRGKEALLLTDASEQADGIYCRRTKGSLDNVARWDPRLRAVWDEAAAIRRAAFEAARRPFPLRPEDRYLFVSRRGDRLTKSGFDTAWQRMIAAALEAGVITPAERFSLHGLKRRGVTDTPGTKADKRDASGHATEAAFQLYDFDVPVVPAASSPEI
ncbi:integrase [Cognatilysobacter lacus]|uniref:Integrase n=1 Tax=Cognatilysobacter lacus TaxID=1643323 RepID=A0A5D8Z8D5_9GAMM|nr:integrase [Lysobacter lacus]TZF90806.1 integrase [Lysobacter lacus]